LGWKIAAIVVVIGKYHQASAGGVVLLDDTDEPFN